MSSQNQKVNVIWLSVIINPKDCNLFKYMCREKQIFYKRAARDLLLSVSVQHGLEQLLFHTHSSLHLGLLHHLHKLVMIHTDKPAVVNEK